MFNEYFGFHENPFSEQHDINYFFLNEANKKLYQDLIADIYQGVRKTILIGNKGTGKTAFLQQLIGLDPFQLRVMYVQAMPGHDLTDDLYRKIIPVANSPDTNEKVQLIEHLTNLRQQGINPVLIVDNAQLLDDSSLIPILRLSEQCFEQRPILQLILATDPTFPDRFEAPALLPFKPSISHQYQLDALTLAETQDFINFRLKQAGCSRENLFSSGAIRTIAARSKGIIKLIIKLCNEALHQASLDGEQIVSEKTVAIASKRLSLNNKKNNEVLNNVPVKTNLETEKHNALSQNQINQKNLKKNAIQPRTFSRLTSFTFVTALLFLIGIAFFLTKPGQKRAKTMDVNLNNANQTPHLNEEVNFHLSSNRHPQQSHSLPVENKKNLQETQTQKLASDQTSLESSETKESVSKTLLTEDKNKLAKLDSLISEVTSQSTSLTKLPSSEQPKLPVKNPIEHSKKTVNKKSSRKSSPHTKNTKRKTLEKGNPTELDKREQLAKQRAQARLKLHQAGINFGIESLMAAAASNDHQTIKLLLSGGIPADIQEQTRGFTALEIAAGYGHNDIIKQLVLKSGASVNLKNFKGRTALMIAAESGHTDTVDFLLSNGAKVNLKDKNGWTALMFAAYNNHLQAAHILLDWGANSQLKNNAGRTATQIARSRGNLGLIKMVTQSSPLGKTSISTQPKFNGTTTAYIAKVERH